MPRRSLLIPLLIFGLTLLISTFFVGDIGVFNDDYFCNQRDVVTGEARELVMNRPWHLWRPLLRVVLIPLLTLLWPWPWALHLISAVLHGVIVAMFYGLLRKLRVGAGIAGAAALAWMVYPVHFEAVLWIDIICTLMSAVIVLGIWHGYVWWITASHWRGKWARLGALAGFGASAWCAAALNEQPAGVLGAMVLLPLVLGWATGSTRVRGMIRTGMPVAACGVGLVVYLIGFFRHVPQVASGNDAEELPVVAAGRLWHLMQQVPKDLALREFGSGAFREGLVAIGDRPFLATVLFGLLGVAGLVWLVRKGEETGGVFEARTDRSPWRLAALGLGWFLMAWVPVAMAHAIPVPRLHYVPSMGLAMMACAGLVALTRRWAMPRWAVLGSGTVLAAMVWAALVVWVGIQVNFQRRCAADRAEMEAIRRVFGATLEPDTFVLPVRLESRTARTGAARFDGYFQQGWYWEWGSGWRLQEGLKRRDVYTVRTGAGVLVDGLWVGEDDPWRVAKVRIKLAAPLPERVGELIWRTPDRQGRYVEWNRLLLMDVEAPGVVKFYTKVRMHVPGREAIEFVPRQVAICAGAKGLAERVLEVHPMPAERRKEHPKNPSGKRER